MEAQPTAHPSENRERTRSEVLTMVDAAEAFLARGEGRIITEQSMLELATKVKHRGEHGLTPFHEIPLHSPSFWRSQNLRST